MAHHRHHRAGLWVRGHDWPWVLACTGTGRGERVSVGGGLGLYAAAVFARANVTPPVATPPRE